MRGRGGDEIENWGGSTKGLEENLLREKTREEGLTIEKRNMSIPTKTNKVKNAYPLHIHTHTTQTI